MISDYVRAALHRAKYELLPDNEGFYGEILDLPGVWANADGLESCREELRGVLENWIVIKLRHNDTDFPVLDGMDLNPKPAEQEVA